MIDHLRGFCDQITVLDDGSTDGTLDYLNEQVDEQVYVAAKPTSTFDQHEGRTRQMLLDFTLSRKPTHVLAIDGDEFIRDGQALRSVLEAQPDAAAWLLMMTEVWTVTPTTIGIRTDGAWRPYQRVHVWKTPEQDGPLWLIPNRRLACPPIPTGAIQAHAQPAYQTIYHFGWADPATRQARYDRYMRLDAGRYHARQHLASIMYPPSRIRLQTEPWPDTDWAAAARKKLVG